VRVLPVDAASYGLVRFDAHGGNAMVDGEGRITFFDFDDCAYSWYANDVAIALAHVVLAADDATAAARAFLPDVLRGYRTVRPFDPAWLPWLPAFLEMAEIFAYAVVFRDAPGDAAGTRWRDRFLRERRGRIEQGIPVVDIDFASFGAAE
jgi:Ser/Thr protein kinase RdoA (MazF antagonist)